MIPNSNRDVFEERIYARYFVSCITKDETSSFLGLSKETRNKADLLVRDPDNAEDYADVDVSAMWFGWNLALSSITDGRMK